MTNSWQEVRLKEVAKPISRSVPVEAGTTYRTLGVKWWGMGAYERESIDGSRTAAKTLSIVREGDLIINKIWVRHGSVAIAGKEVDGCAGSGEFPTFELDLNRIDPRWIHWQTKMKSFWEKCDDLSRGTSGKNRIKPELFLTINIPLPPLTEQRRIVAHIESLAARVNEAQRLREEADEEAEKLFSSNLGMVYQGLLKKYKTIPLIELVEPDRGISYGVVLLGEDQEDGVPTLRAGDLKQYRVSTTNLKRIAPEIAEKFRRTKLLGNELLLKIRGGYGDVAICPPTLVNANVSREIAVIPLLDMLIPEYGMYVLSAPASQERMSAKLRGTSYVGLNLSDVRKLPIPVPPLDEQRRIVAYLDELQAKVNALRELQVKGGEELSALMLSILDKAFKGEL